MNLMSAGLQKAAGDRLRGFLSSMTSNPFKRVMTGLEITAIIQSSSATMALTFIMLNMGWIPFPVAAAMVLGENIGTTITANIAASVGNVASKRAALAHTVFNLFGVAWALILFKPFTAMIGKIIELRGYLNPAFADFAVESSTSATGVAALYGLSMLHTLFNVINTCILIWFPGAIERIVTTVIKGRKENAEEVHKLKYIGSVAEYIG